MAQAVGCRGPLLGHQLQHGKQEVGEALGLLPRPLVLVDQHLQQAPGLQLGDVFQVTCRRPCSGVSERPGTHAAGILKKNTLARFRSVGARFGKTGKVALFSSAVCV